MQIRGVMMGDRTLVSCKVVDKSVLVLRLVVCYYTQDPMGKNNNIMYSCSLL